MSCTINRYYLCSSFVVLIFVALSSVSQHVIGQAHSRVLSRVYDREMLSWRTQNADGVCLMQRAIQRTHLCQPVNNRCSTNAGLMLSQRHRPWTISKTTLNRYKVFAGKPFISQLIDNELYFVRISSPTYVENQVFSLTK